MGIFRSIVILLVGAALATFLWSNYDRSVVIYFTEHFRTVPIPLAGALVTALLAGFLLAVGISLPNQFRLRSHARELKRKVDRLEEENAELRKLPLTETFRRTPPRREEEREAEGVESAEEPEPKPPTP